MGRKKDQDKKTLNMKLKDYTSRFPPALVGNRALNKLLNVNSIGIVLMWAQWLDAYCKIRGLGTLHPHPNAGCFVG